MKPTNEPNIHGPPNQHESKDSVPIIPARVAADDAAGDDVGTEEAQSTTSNQPHVYADAKVLPDEEDSSTGDEDTQDRETEKPTSQTNRSAFLFVAGIFIVAVVIVAAMLSSLCCGSSTAEQGPLEVSNQRSPLSKEEEASIINLINSITLSNRNVSYPVADSDIASPEEHALAWLIEDDPFLEPPFNFSFSKWYRIVQRFSLATLYYHMMGANWTNTTGWLKNEDECEWFGLICNFTNPGQNSEIEGSITEILLGDNNLQGRIPEDLMRLRRLQRIQMEENSITGPFPATIGMHLPDLEKISIWRNQLSGTLPPSIGRLTHLQAMFIGKNQLSGTIPSEMGNMTSLAKFNPDTNRFNGTLPTELGLLTDMENFYAVENMFSGQIPESLSNWQKIQNAFFSGNAFTGSMPRGLCEAPDLIKLEADCAEVQCDSCCTRCT